MKNSDGKSVAPPLRQRKSRRFDRSGSAQRGAAKAGDGPDPVPADEVTAASGGEIEAHFDEQALSDSSMESSQETLTFVPTIDEPVEENTTPPGPTVIAEGSVRSKTLDERQACGRCGHELLMINIEVDGNVLIMESCDNCDARRWHLADEPVELQEVLDHVGEHAGRRR